MCGRFISYSAGIIFEHVHEEAKVVGITVGPTYNTKAIAASDLIKRLGLRAPNVSGKLRSTRPSLTREQDYAFFYQSHAV
jgi:hypothetical protein